MKRKRWRKLHLGPDLVSGEIICSELTTDNIGDPIILPDLLDQIDGPVAGFIADGAYDGAPTRDLLATRFGEIIEVIISPPKTAVESPQFKARNRQKPQRYATAISPKSRPGAGSPGRNPPAIIDAAGSRHRWTDGRQ